jgi:hypothetical protein
MAVLVDYARRSCAAEAQCLERESKKEHAGFAFGITTDTVIGVAK